MDEKRFITSKKNRWIQLVQNIQKGKRQAQGYFLAEGEKTIESLLKKFKAIALLTNENTRRNFHNNCENCLTVTSQIWNKLSDLPSPPPIIGIFEKPKLNLNNIEKSNKILVLDKIQDPGNLGTIIRTAAAFAWGEIVCIKGTVDAFCPKVIRSSAGTIIEVNLYTSIEEPGIQAILVQNKYTIINTSSHASIEFSKAVSKNQKKCLVLGNEGQGLSESWLNLPNSISVKIPLINPNVESLNVAVSAGILMSELNS
ncbi:MAG: RNA methyltransferase [Candidatus Caenarcaniphilales bacterium]|nr:RNA methyltransferase [Candidatus Caenarcaniphilales bacterium]